MEPKFTLQRHGESSPSRPQTLTELLLANREDEDLCEWLKRAPVGAGLVTGGGAAPVVSVRRVA